MEEKKKITQIEIDNIIDKSINLSIISRLFNLKLLNEKQYFMIKEKLESFY